MRLLSPAKINLHLRILRRRPDGYHDLWMLMEKIDLCDEIVLEKISSGIELSAPGLDIPPEKNLVWKAAMALRRSLQQVSGSSCSGVRLHLTKKIPMGGGLGGGSGNAATVLKGLNEFWGLNWPAERLAEIGKKLGADIPFFIGEGPAQVEGIGDKITPLKSLPNLSIILINPGIHVATPWAYAQWDQNELTQENQSVRPPCTFAETVGILHNDFEAVVFPHFPEIQEAKEALLRAGAKGALMTGSGATVFGLFETKEARDRAFGKIKAKPRWQIFGASTSGKSAAFGAAILGSNPSAPTKICIHTKI